MPMRMRAALLAALAGAARADTYDFMIMGDWGGIPFWPYHTPGESGVAKALGKLAGQVGARYTLALGDNFYMTGVRSQDDSRFRETFEDVFTHPSLQAAGHFRVVAGNHDHYGNCSAQLAYSAISARWHFPDYYYDFVETLGNGLTVHHIMIDTVLLAGQSEQPVTRKRLAGWQYTGPPNVTAAEEQWQWLNKTLASSTADYLLVAGHFPVWSVCEHGPTSFLVDRLRPMLQAARVSAYFAGHDHCAEHLQEGGIEYHGVGAADTVDPSMAHRGAVPEGALVWHYSAGFLGLFEGAFAHVSVGADGLVVSHYSSSGKKLYEAPPVSPRQRRQLQV